MPLRLSVALFQDLYSFLDGRFGKLPPLFWEPRDHLELELVVKGLRPLNVPQTIDQDRKCQLRWPTTPITPLKFLAVVTNIPCTRKDSRPCTLYNLDLALVSSIATADVGLLWERAE